MGAFLLQPVSCPPERPLQVKSAVSLMRVPDRCLELAGVPLVAQARQTVDLIRVLYDYFRIGRDEL